MDTTRTINLVLTSLNYDMLVQQDLLEEMMNNSSERIESRVVLIKDRLRELITIEQMILKFQSLVTANTNK
jgi:hypothetical protein